MCELAPAGWGVCAAVSGVLNLHICTSVTVNDAARARRRPSDLLLPHNRWRPYAGVEDRDVRHPARSKTPAHSHKSSVDLTDQH